MKPVNTRFLDPEGPELRNPGFGFPSSNLSLIKKYCDEAKEVVLKFQRSQNWSCCDFAADYHSNRWKFWSALLQRLVCACACVFDAQWWDALTSRLMSGACAWHALVTNCTWSVWTMASSTRWSANSPSGSATSTVPNILTQVLVTYFFQLTSTKAVITIAIRLQYDYDVSRAPASIRRDSTGAKNEHVNFSS